MDIGSGYTDRTSYSEIIHYLAKSKRLNKITEPLNSGEKRYYSLLSDGPSNAKTMDEKELVLIKTCESGKPAFNILALMVVEEGNSDTIFMAIEGAIAEGEFQF